MIDIESVVSVFLPFWFFKHCCAGQIKHNTHIISICEEQMCCFNSVASTQLVIQTIQTGSKSLKVTEVWEMGVVKVWKTKCLFS